MLSDTGLYYLYLANKWGSINSEDVYFNRNRPSRATCSNFLRRLHMNGSLRRERKYDEKNRKRWWYEYYITRSGKRRLSYLRKKRKHSPLHIP